MKNKSMSLNDTIDFILKEGIQQIIQVDGLTQTIKSNSDQIMKIAQQSLKEKNFRPKTLTVETDKINEQQNPPIKLADGANIPDSLLSKISDNTIDQMIQGLPKEYTDLITDDFTSVYQTLKEATSNPDELISKMTEEKINDILEAIPTKFIDFSVNSVEVTTKGKNKQLKLDLVFNLKPIKPYVKFSLVVNSIKTELGRIVFQIDGDGTISEILVGHRAKSFNVNLGSLFATFSISLKEIKVAKRTAVGEQEAPLRTLASKDVMIDLPKVTIPYG